MISYRSLLLSTIALNDVCFLYSIEKNFGKNPWPLQTSQYIRQAVMYHAAKESRINACTFKNFDDYHQDKR